DQMAAVDRGGHCCRLAEPHARARAARVPSSLINANAGGRLRLATDPCNKVPLTSKSRAFPAGERGGAGSAVGRDGRDAVRWPNDLIFDDILSARSCRSIPMALADP